LHKLALLVSSLAVAAPTPKAVSDIATITGSSGIAALTWSLGFNDATSRDLKRTSEQRLTG
jgi:hypothetical protein